MNFRLSTGIYKTGQLKPITLILLMFLPLIAGPVYVIWRTIAQANETDVGEKVVHYFYALYLEQPILLLPTGIISGILLILFLSEKSRSTAYIKVNSEGFEYNLPLMVRDILNGFSATSRVVPWDNVSGVRASLGERSKYRGVVGPPSSRLISSKIEIIDRDFQVILNPYRWLLEGESDHRLSSPKTSLGLDEDAVRVIFEQCPLMLALSSLKNVKLETMPLDVHRKNKINHILFVFSMGLLFILAIIVLLMMVFSK